MVLKFWKIKPYKVKGIVFWCNLYQKDGILGLYYANIYAFMHISKR